MSLLDHLRLDIGDDDAVVVSSGISQVAGASSSTIVRHIRIDVGDDTSSISTSSNTGYVSAPSGATDNAVARFDGTTGELIQNSTTIINDAGDMTVNGNLTITGMLIGFPKFRIVTSGATVNILTTDNNVVINKTIASPTTVNLPVGILSGHTIQIKDGRGDASINNITIVPTAATIDSLPSLVMTQNFQNYTLMFDGTNWGVA